MVSVVPLLASLGHVARTRTLLASGLTRRQLAAACREGRVSQPLRGWFATRWGDVDQLRAIRAGAPIGCVSALRRWGVWSGQGDALHLHAQPAGVITVERASAPGGASLRLPHPQVDPVIARQIEVRACSSDPLRTHWGQRCDRRGELDWIVSPVDAVAQAIRCQDEENALACIDSALHEGVVTRAELSRIEERLPRRLAHVMGLVDPRADSGNETIVRLRLLRLGHQVEPQVRVGGVGFIDLLVDGLLPLEIDSEAHHSSTHQLRVDRAAR